MRSKRSTPVIQLNISVAKERCKWGSESRSSVAFAAPKRARWGPQASSVCLVGPGVWERSRAVRCGGRGELEGLTDDFVSCRW